MVFAVSPRNCNRFKPDLMEICILGIVCEAASARSSEPPASGKRIVRDAFVAAFSNFNFAMIDSRENRDI